LDQVLGDKFSREGRELKAEEGVLEILRLVKGRQLKDKSHEERREGPSVEGKRQDSLGRERGHNGKLKGGR